MSKALVIAFTEALTAVRSKAFVVNLLILPIAVGAMVLINRLAEDTADLSDRTLAVVDRAGWIGPGLEDAAKAYNEHVAFETGEDGQRTQVKPKWIIELVALGDPVAEGDPADDAEIELALSDRVRAGELSAFAVLPADVLTPEAEGAVQYYAQDQVFDDLPRWLGAQVGRVVRERRMATAEIDPAVVEQVDLLSRHVGFQRLGLVERSGDGGAAEARETNDLETFLLPAAGMFVMFIMVMFAGPTLLNAVLEEKMQRIAELLVASVTPFQLMLGKLLGAVMFAIVLAAVYLAAGLFTADYYDVASLLTPRYYTWLGVFSLLALVIYGSIFVAIGSACSEIRDANNLMAPAMILVMMPLWCWFIVIKNPDSTASVALSLFPPFTPMLMFLRLAAPPGPPMWQVVLSVVLTTGFSALCLAAAARVFRIGILSYGQAPTLRKLLRWAATGR
ncbi:MAG: ABC transporter permease [Planctomycetota bacterium]